jgi:hypothetical protein
MECRLDDLDERVTALEGVENRGEVYLDSAEPISAPRVADTHPDDGRAGLDLQTMESLTRASDLLTLLAVESSRRSTRRVPPQILSPST